MTGTSAHNSSLSSEAVANDKNAKAAGAKVYLFTKFRLVERKVQITNLQLKVWRIYKMFIVVDFLAHLSQRFK